MDPKKRKATAARLETAVSRLHAALDRKFNAANQAASAAAKDCERLARLRAPVTGHGAELVQVIADQGRVAEAVRDGWWMYLAALCSCPATSREYREARAGFDVCAEGAALGTPTSVVVRQLLDVRAKGAHADKSARRTGHERAGEARKQKVRDIARSLGWRRTGKRGEIAALVREIQKRFPPRERQLIDRDLVRRALGLRR